MAYDGDLGDPSILPVSGTGSGTRFVAFGAPHRLLTAQRSWQENIIEEPAAIPATDGGWWLFYSGSLFDTPNYATGLAYCPDLDGPCRETSDRPFLTTTALKEQGQRNGRFRGCRSLQLAPVLPG